jgi:hypothetical protein
VTANIFVRFYQTNPKTMKIMDASSKGKVERKKERYAAFRQVFHSR